MSKKASVLLLFLTIVVSLIILSSSSFAYDCGDINCSGGEPDIADITRLIDYLYLSHNPLCDPMLADVNNSGGEPDISDITNLIIFLYLTHNPLYCESTGLITDIDGNIYQTVKIGDQWWMAENLKVTHYRNGEEIPNVTDDNTWEYLSTGAYCEYDNDVSYVTTYGRLYNWFAVNDSRNLTPEGWHVPTDAEWYTLTNFLGGSTIAGGKLKEEGYVHWLEPNTGATNESGFSALPGGWRSHYGPFVEINELSHFWTSTSSSSYQSLFRFLSYDDMLVRRDDYDKEDGNSIRCVRDVK